MQSIISPTGDLDTIQIQLLGLVCLLPRASPVSKYNLESPINPGEPKKLSSPRGKIAKIIINVSFYKIPQIQQQPLMCSPIVAFPVMVAFLIITNLIQLAQANQANYKAQVPKEVKLVRNTLHYQIIPILLNTHLIVRNKPMPTKETPNDI